MQRARLGRNVIALGVVSLLTDASSDMIFPLLPVFLTTTLGASATALGAIEGAADTTAALLRLASGWWSDRLRRRKPLVVFGYGVASLVRPLIALATSAGQVLAIRLADRVGKGVRGAPRDALIADSVDPSIRGRAFGFHRAMDHLGAVIGPLVAFALLQWAGMPLRTVFLLAAVPAVAALVAVIMLVRDVPQTALPRHDIATGAGGPLPRAFWSYLVALLVFTLGNAGEAFLLLRAQDLGVPVATLPLLWAYAHAVKSATSTAGGALSDRIGRRTTLMAGWVLFAIVYGSFALATDAWHAWVLFTVHALFYALTDGPTRALVADLVSVERRGAAYGWFNATVGLAALPGALLFGYLWDVRGPTMAFMVAAALAIVAVLGMARLRTRNEPD